jgi:putative ABC transport system permease protein
MNMFSGIIVACRYFVKNKFSSLINITGLAIGLTGFTCIMLYVEHELSFDKFHPGYKDTYRIVKDFVNPDGTSVPDATTPPALTKSLRTEFRDVETATRLVPNRGRLYLLQYDDKRFYETELIRVDQQFFDVFDFPFVAGSKQKALSHIHSIILTKSIAEKYFGDEDPLEKIIRMNVNGGTDYKVSGVLKDIPANSHFTFDIIIPFESTRDPDTDWQRSGFYTYARLKPNADPGSFATNISETVKKHVPNSLDHYYVQPLADIHLHSHLKWELSPNGDTIYIRILVLIGTFILIIACINYINLITAKSSERAREVGIRKTIGAVRGQLIRQFLTESFLTVFVALILALFITSLILPLMTPLAGVDLSVLLLTSDVMKWSLPFTFFIALAAGFYPAIYLSGFQPLKSLRGGLITGHGGAPLRKALVVFQFTMSSGLIAGMLIVSTQLDFMRDKDLGFNEENILLVPNVRGGIGAPSSVTGAWDEKVRQMPGIVNVARADGVLGSNNSVNGIGFAPANSHISLNFIRIDYDFIPTLEIALSEGRNFSRDFVSDSTAIIINEEAVRQLGLQEPVIGQRLAWDDEAGKTHDVTIVGIAKDFHFTNLHSAISPFGFILEVGNGSNFFIRIGSKELATTLANIEQVWSLHNPGKPFEYSFQDQYIANLHLNDERFGKLFSVFTMLAIALACLGLFGFTAFLAESRTKEIGVRKILGASVVSILRLLSREYVVMIVISLVIAFPLTYFLMKIWLQNFAYQTDVNWGVFAAAGIISIVLAVVTISFHAIKVATNNPVNSLRSE